MIPIIDLFAGPGGLGEGFSSITDENGDRAFHIKLSIEKDEFAHKTLELRSFFRQFPIGQVPDDYYDYVRNYNPNKDKINRAILFSKFPEEAQRAREEAWQCTLGDEENFPRNIVDLRIKNALGDGKNWLLIGGPPCQAYSLVGRSRNRGLFEEDHRVFLYREYLRIIAVHHPAVFVMENVKGLLSAKLEGDSIFEWMKNDLKEPGRLFPGNGSHKYKIYSLVQSPIGYEDDDSPKYSKDSDFLIRTEKYGIPQKRHRVILLGIREDLGLIDFDPLRKSNEVKLKDVIGQLPKLRSGIGREIGVTIVDEKRKYKKVIDSHTYWLETANNYLSQIKEKDPTFDVCFDNAVNLTQGSNYIEYAVCEENNPLKDWYFDEKIGGILNHETRTHLKEDIARYLFSSLYLRYNGDFPKLRDYHDWLLPDHKNARGTKFADRFRTQRPEEPATTITSHISKDGHYFIHYDPEQCRSLTVREAARIQTFPDNYFFCGARTQQYHQVGNAVPPYLARQIGEVVLNVFKKHIILNNDEYINNI